MMSNWQTLVQIGFNLCEVIADIHSYVITIMILQKLTLWPVLLAQVRLMISGDNRC